MSDNYMKDLLGKYGRNKQALGSNVNFDINGLVDKEFIGGYCEYFIVMPDEDTFILKIYDNINRPNNPDNDDLIQSYMSENYGNRSYEVIDKDNGRFETVDIK